VARFYADEQFPKRVVELLRSLGHDVLTVQEAGNASQKNPDEEVLAFAVSIDRYFNAQSPSFYQAAYITTRPCWYHCL